MEETEVGAIPVLLADILIERIVVSKYRIEIPKPSAKRFEKDRRLLIKCYNGWRGPSIVKDHEIPIGETHFEFDFEGPIEYTNHEVLDGDYRHEFVVKYQNSTGSRVEEIRVSPEKLEAKSNNQLF